MTDTFKLVDKPIAWKLDSSYNTSLATVTSGTCIRIGDMVYVDVVFKLINVPGSAASSVLNGFPRCRNDSTIDVHDSPIICYKMFTYPNAPETKNCRFYSTNLYFNHTSDLAIGDSYHVFGSYTCDLTQ